MTDLPIAEPIRRVVCAAIRAADGDVLLGIRHYSMDMHRQIGMRTDGSKFHRRSGGDQGFVDQYGEYMTRQEAFNVAAKANQIVNWNVCESGTLCSEGLY